MNEIEQMILDALPISTSELSCRDDIPWEQIRTAIRSLKQAGRLRQSGINLLPTGQTNYLIRNRQGEEIAIYRAATPQDALAHYYPWYTATEVSDLPRWARACPACASAKTSATGIKSSGQPVRRCDDCGKRYMLNGFKPGKKRYVEKND